MKKTKALKKVYIMGESISPFYAPKLYKLALENPEMVEAQIRGMMKAQGFTSPGMPIAILGSDLG